MDNINKAIDMIMKKIASTEDEFEVGDKFVGVFKDGVIVVSNEVDESLKIDVIFGPPEYFDFEISTGLVKEEHNG